MDLRGSRPVLVGAGLVALALCIGNVSAAPYKPVPKASPLPTAKVPPAAALDPALAKQVTPRALKQDEALALQKQAAPAEGLPAFKIKRLDPIQRAALLGQSDPAALPGPRVFTARVNYHDDLTYMEIAAHNDAGVSVRPKHNYVFFQGPVAVFASIFTRPSARIHFRAVQGTRYLLECAVDASFQGTSFTATDSVREYSVRADDKTTLLYMRDQAGDTEDVVVQIAADKPSWYLDGCELTAAPR